jgi:transposase
LLTLRAGVETCRQVGENARPVAELADELGVCWWTVMAAVIEHGTPLVDDRDRVGPVTKLGVDETSLLRANRHHATRYATGLVDLDAGIVIDMVEGNAAPDLRRWCATGLGVVGRYPGGDHRSGRVVPGRPRSAPRSRHPGG